jgi:uncharacterized spore protein YtfJ
MTTSTDIAALEAALRDDVTATRDALSVERVFGSPRTIDGTTIVPVARFGGGAGGGGGAGTDSQHGEGHGFGSALGLGARPVGVYTVEDGHLAWKPAIDVDRLARGAQVLAGIALICAALVALRRRS